MPPLHFPLRRLFSTTPTTPLIILSGPSGSGKSTLLTRLFAAHPTTFGFSISHTTRVPRPTEENGTHYHFTTAARFQQLREKNAFVEYAKFAGFEYGTSHDAVREVQRRGRVCVLDIDLEGIKQVKASGVAARYVFIAPPSVGELERRLRARGTETEETLWKRLERVKVEMEWAREGGHDCVVVNGEVERAYEELEGFVLGVLGRGGDAGGEVV